MFQVKGSINKSLSLFQQSLGKHDLSCQSLEANKTFVKAECFMYDHSQPDCPLINTEALRLIGNKILYMAVTCIPS